MSQNLQNFVKFQKFQLENLVDFEKCCKTRTFLQKSEPIQPKTSNILPKFCLSAVVSLTGAGGWFIFKPSALVARSSRRMRRSATSGRRAVPSRAERGCSASCSSVAGCGKLQRARSRLYRTQILQVHMRLKALAEIYKMHSFALL